MSSFAGLESAKLPNVSFVVPKFGQKSLAMLRQDTNFQASPLHLQLNPLYLLFPSFLFQNCYQLLNSSLLYSLQSLLLHYADVVPWCILGRESELNLGCSLQVFPQSTTTTTAPFTTFDSYHAHSDHIYLSCHNFAPSKWLYPKVKATEITVLLHLPFKQPINGYDSSDLFHLAIDLWKGLEILDYHYHSHRDDHHTNHFVDFDYFDCAMKKSDLYLGNLTEHDWSILDFLIHRSCSKYPLKYLAKLFLEQPKFQAGATKL